MRAWCHGLWLRIRGVLSASRHEQDLQDEVAFHLAMREAQLRSSGTTEPDREARRRFGSAARIRDEMRDEWRVLPRLTSALQDCRHAARALWRSRTFAAVVVLTLAFGIGANTAVFSIVNAVLLRPLGFADPDRLVLLHEAVPAVGIERVPFSAADFADVRRDARAYESIGAFLSSTAELSGENLQPAQIRVAQVTADVFPMLGITPSLGRMFTVAEDTPGHDLALISRELWQNRYGADPAIVGKLILLDRRPYTVIGVMPVGLQFPRRGPQFNNQPADVWIPSGIGDGQALYGGGYQFSVIAKLRAGVTIEQARAELRALAPQIQARYPAALRSRREARLVLSATPLRNEIVGAVGTPLLLLLGAIAMVLLVACANVANLLLSRAAARQHEIGLRVALGASRLRLLQLQFSEPLLLAAVGGVLGVLFARVALRAVPAVLTQRIPSLDNLSIDLRVLAFTAAVSLATAVIVTLAPLAAAERQSPSDALHDSGVRTTGHRRNRIHNALVVSTVALSFVLLVTAGLFLRSFSALLQHDRGYRPAGVLTAAVALPWEAYPTANSVFAFQDALLRRINALPGVRRAALATDLPLEGAAVGIFTREGQTDGIVPPARRTLVNGPYFEALGIRVLRGRGFAREEYDGGRAVAIVNDKLARRYWPGEDPIGKRLKWGAATSPNPWLTIVGVVQDTDDGRQALATMGDDRPVHIYEPLRQLSPFAINARGSRAGRDLRLAVLADTDPEPLAPSVRHEFAALDPQLALARVATMQSEVRESIAPQRFSTEVVTIFAVGALLLVSIGLYGLLALIVTEHTREIGVRLALGAEPAAVRRLMVTHGLRLVAAGIAIGFVMSLGTTEWLSSLLVSTKTFDPLTFVAVPLVLTAVAVLACFVPALRASRVNPLVALRGD